MASTIGQFAPLDPDPGRTTADGTVPAGASDPAASQDSRMAEAGDPVWSDDGSAALRSTHALGSCLPGSDAELDKLRALTTAPNLLATR
ncbi:unnamed protein product [Phytophthora fragariaefolia]|uniref:Unnamed protein product n=1 Tax=Phytophthora fragariaefolia TaxID=1490495 RepID=A0A9W6YP77_9STRA|nr:unnamed protein product [Phytophthora fragariaefolia]